MIARIVEPVRIERLTLGLGLLGALASVATGVGRWSSVLLGAAFMLVQFRLLRLLVSRLISGRTSRTSALALLALKLVLFLALLGGMLYRFTIAPMSFAFGASVLLVAAVMQAVFLGEPVVKSDRGNDKTET